MRSSRHSLQTPGLTRRSFLKAASSSLLPSMIAGVFTDSSLLGEVGQKVKQSFSVRPESEEGFFSVFYGDAILFHRAFLQVETEIDVVQSYGERSAVTHEPNYLHAHDTHGICDMSLRWRVEEGGELLVLGVTVTNPSKYDIHVTNIYPLIALSAQGGGCAFWQDPGRRALLTDEWERCYGAAGVYELGEKESVRSAWDIHFFDPRNQLSCSLSYLTVPNVKLSYSLTLVHGERERKSDVVVRADTRSGRRGVLVRPGDSFSVEDIMMFFHRGSPQTTLERYAQLVVRHNHLKPPSIMPVGWVDWYFAKAKTSERELLENLDFIARELKDFGMEYVQLDSGWQVGVETIPPPHNVIAGGPWMPNSKFPRGMKWYADEIRNRGLKPGIWVRPFHVIDGAPERTEHPEWFNDKGQMDFSNPGVHTYLHDLFTRLTKKWGYEYIKYDFPSFDLFGEWGPKLFADQAAQAKLNTPTKTNIQAYRESLQTLADAARGKAHLLACNSVMPATLGLADVFRIGDDVGDWERTVTYGVKSVSARYYTNGFYWANDPDCLLVREPFTIEQARMWASLIALSGGAVFVSEDLPRLPSERLEILKKVMPVYKNAEGGYRFGRPLDLLEHNPPRVWSLDVSREFGKWNVTAVFNWDEQEMQTDISFDGLGLQPGLSYHVYEFWKKGYIGLHQGSVGITLPPQSCQVFAIHRSVQRPTILSTTRHITQGGVELYDVVWAEKTNTLSGRSRVIRNNPHDLVIHTIHKQVENVEGALQVASNHPDLLRIRITADSTKDIGWRVRFT